MNYSNIKYCDIANGPGVRTSLFVSGCRLHCKGCFNEVAWPFTSGEPFGEAAQQAVLKSLEPRYVHGITVLGGEPMEPENQEGLLPFLTQVRLRQPEKTIWCFTGYVLEDLLAGGRKSCEATSGLLRLIDVLVDGPFMMDLHDVSLRFRGSSNQRVIDLAAMRESGALDAEAATLKGEVRLWADDPVFSTHTMD